MTKTQFGRSLLLSFLALINYLLAEAGSSLPLLAPNELSAFFAGVIAH